MSSRRARRTRSTMGLALIAGFFASSCAAPTVSLRQGPRSFTESDYDKVYRRWTRSENEFAWSRMADVLRVSATFEAWEFRWAYVVRYTHDYSMDAAERETMLRTTLADAQRHHRFLVTLEGENVRESDLTGRLSAWRVLLLDDDGHATEPIEIERIRRPSAVEVMYFASVNPHRHTFRIVFPVLRDDGTPSIPEDARRIRMRFAGPRGQVDLAWALEAGSVPPPPPPPPPPLEPEPAPADVAPTDEDAGAVPTDAGAPASPTNALPDAGAPPTDSR